MNSEFLWVLQAIWTDINLFVKSSPKNRLSNYNLSHFCQLLSHIWHHQISSVLKICLTKHIDFFFVYFFHSIFYHLFNGHMNGCQIFLPQNSVFKASHLHNRIHKSAFSKDLPRNRIMSRVKFWRLCIICQNIWLTYQ